MKKWLENHPTDSKKSVKDSVYINRINKRIDRELDNLLWLAMHHPQIFLDEETEFSDTSGKIVSHRRLKKILLVINNLNPKLEVELVRQLRDLDHQI